MTELQAAISSQPATLEKMLEVPLEAHVARISEARRYWLVGTGTSFNAAEFGAQVLQLAGVAAIPVPAMRFACWTPPLLESDAVIVITHTAETAYALRARQVALAARVPTVSIVRQGIGWHDALHTIERERSETYTASYTAALVLLARLAVALGASGIERALLNLPARTSAALADPTPDGVVLGSASIVIAGAGPSAVSAREGALKMREAARLPAVGYDLEDLLHGHAVPLRPGDDLVLLEAESDPHDLGSAIGQAAAEEGLRISRLDVGERVHPLLDQVPLTVLLQRLALRIAIERRQDPDTVIVGAWAAEHLWRRGLPQRGRLP